MIISCSHTSCNHTAQELKAKYETIPIGDQTTTQKALLGNHITWPLLWSLVCSCPSTPVHCSQPGSSPSSAVLWTCWRRSRGKSMRCTLQELLRVTLTSNFPASRVQHVKFTVHVTTPTKKRYQYRTKKLMRPFICVSIRSTYPGML